MNGRSAIVRAAYNLDDGRYAPPGLRQYDAAVASELTAFDPPPADENYIVQQHLQEEVDINTIMRRFGATGVFPEGGAMGMYGDFTGLSDYASAVALIERADHAFMQLPAEVRERFSNDPGELVRFAASSSPEEFKKRTSWEVRPEVEAPVLPAPTVPAIVVPPVVMTPPEAGK